MGDQGAAPRWRFFLRSDGPILAEPAGAGQGAGDEGGGPEVWVVEPTCPLQVLDKPVSHILVQLFENDMLTHRRFAVSELCVDKP